MHRLLATLTDERLLERGPAGTYRLGLAVHELGASVAPHVGLHEAAMPAMAGLRHATGETVQLAVLDGMHSVYVERLESPHTVRIFATVGTGCRRRRRARARCCSPRCPPRSDARLAAWTPEHPTPHSIADEATLRRRLAEIAARAWADNREESRLGVVSVGAVVRDGAGAAVAAVSVAVPVSRAATAAMRRYTALMIDTADVISRRLALG